MAVVSIMRLVDPTSPSRYVVKVSERDGVFLGPIHAVQTYKMYGLKYLKQLHSQYERGLFEILEMDTRTLKPMVRQSEIQYEIPKIMYRKL